jgi:ATP adenylyltransferase
VSAEFWDAVQRRAAAAHASGAMYRIESEPHLMHDAGVDFVVRCAVDYASQAAKQPKGRPGNPFADPEPELLVGDVSSTHVALLNKYHVIESHLLVVTRGYVDQNVLLDRADFDALARCFPSHAPALAFYNGGTGSGASQPHKHLQVVTLPLAPWADTPMAPVLAAQPASLPFRHALAPVGMDDAARLHDCYRALLAQAGIEAIPHADGERQSGPYSLLITRDWMLLVPRSREAFEGVSINSIAYAGALFVREPHQLEAVRRAGPMAVLGHTGMPRSRC